MSLIIPPRLAHTLFCNSEKKIKLCADVDLKIYGKNTYIALEEAQLLTIYVYHSSAESESPTLKFTVYSFYKKNCSYLKITDHYRINDQDLSKRKLFIREFYQTHISYQNCALRNRITFIPMQIFYLGQTTSTNLSLIFLLFHLRRNRTSFDLSNRV